MTRLARVAAQIALLMICLGAIPAPARAAQTSAPTGVPTLGSTAFAAEATPLAGFGTVRPAKISYKEHIATSAVSAIHWSSWGGARAVGHGRAVWVWPGWCVPCASVELPATVVAFDEGTCNGQLVYRRLEWFFPGRGMTFNTKLADPRLCKTAPVTHVRITPHDGCAAVTVGTVLADKVTRDGYTLRCPAARRLIASLPLGRYLNRRARFETHGWWCGTNPSGSFQFMSCARGDFDAVSFALKSRGG